MPEIKTSTHYWNACNRNGAGAICAGFSGSSILSISAELLQVALIIILLKAGLSLNLNDLKKVGRRRFYWLLCRHHLRLLDMCCLHQSFWKFHGLMLR